MDSILKCYIDIPFDCGSVHIRLICVRIHVISLSDHEKEKDQIERLMYGTEVVVKAEAQIVEKVEHKIVERVE